MDNVPSQRFHVRGRQSTYQILQASEMISAAPVYRNSCVITRRCRNTLASNCILRRECFFPKGFAKWMHHKLLSQQGAEMASLLAAKHLPQLTARLFTPCGVPFPAQVPHGRNYTSLLAPWVHRAKGAVCRLLAAVSSPCRNILKPEKSRHCHLGMYPPEISKPLGTLFARSLWHYSSLEYKLSQATRVQRLQYFHFLLQPGPLSASSEARWARDGGWV